MYIPVLLGCMNQINKFNTLTALVKKQENFKMES